MHYDLEIHDGSRSEDSGEIAVAEAPRLYRVLDPGGLFKNGTRYQCNSFVPLTRKTAAGFIALKEIQPCDK